MTNEPKTQLDKFEEAARELETDDDPSASRRGWEAGEAQGERGRA